MIRAFLVYSADDPKLLGPMNIEGRQDTERRADIFSPGSRRSAGCSSTSSPQAVSATFP